jgi:uncharacterized protein YecE (DUF72 family)
MSTRFHIAAKDLRGPITAYAKRFDFLEVTVVPAENGKGKEGGTEPVLATLRRWRKQVPPHFDFSVIGGPALGKLRPGQELERELAAATAGIAALQARCFVLRTPPDVTPSALARERLAKLVERFPRDVTHVVWEPSGLWETGDAAVLAKKIGVVLAVDAAREPVPVGNIAYVRLRALGETRSFSEATLERVVRGVGPRKDAFVIIETDTALVECKRLRRLAQRSRASQEGGMGRLVRPRGGIMVRDDEQE